MASGGFEILGIYGGRTDPNSSLGYVCKIKIGIDRCVCEKCISETITALTIAGFICLVFLPHHQVLEEDENVFKYNEGWKYSCEGKLCQVPLPVSDIVRKIR